MRPHRKNNMLQAGFYSSCLGFHALSEQFGMAWCHGHSQSLEPDPTSLGYKSMGFTRWRIVEGFHIVKERSTAKLIYIVPSQVAGSADLGVSKRLLLGVWDE